MQKASFFPYNWHIDESQEEFTSIRVYGLNKKNENVCVRVDDFTPYVYIELPTSRVRWTATKAQILGDKLDSLMGRQKPVKKALTWKKKLYGAHINPDTGERKLYPYLFCSFYNIKDLTVLGYRLKGSVHVVGLGSLKLKIHESDANPILQMTCCRKLPTAGWVKFQGRKIREDEMDTLCDHEYQVKYKHLAPLDCNIVPRPKIMGFDIEVNSWNPSAMPVATDSRNKVFQISCVMAREGDGPDDYDKYILSLGDPDEKIVGYDVIVYTYPTEAELLTGFTELVREENPNIITGYNILGFDIPYMIARAKNTFCLTDFSKQGFHKYAKAVEKTIKWSSSAYKNQEFQFLDAEGRVYVDLLPLVRRDFKFNNYKLKTISTYFLGQTKDPLSVKGIFKCYRIGTKKNKKGEYGKKARRAMGLVGKYCLEENTVVSTKHGNIPIKNLYGQNMDVLSWNEQGNNIEISVQSNFFDNGKRNCIELELEDGRIIVCTPDHQIATVSGWVQAGDIPLDCMVKVGPILPNADIDTPETVYARVLGLLMTDGHISKDRCMAYIGNILDAQLFAEDIETLSGSYPAIYKGLNCWRVVVPIYLRAKINAEKFICGNNRTDSTEVLPDTTSWSKSQKREFLGGLFGGDGGCTCMSKCNKFTPITFTQSRTNKEIIITYMRQLQKLLENFDISSKYRIQKRDPLYIGILSIPMHDNDMFMTKIGYRYCYTKTIRSSISVMYQRIKKRVKKQYQIFLQEVKESGLSIREGYDKNVSKYNFPPTYDTMKGWIRKGFPTGRKAQACRSFPRVIQFLTERNLLKYFIGSGQHTYALGKEEDTLPVFELGLVSRKKVGIKQVYDITVERTHSLLANGIIAHNCVQDSVLVVRLMDKLKTWVGLTEMAKTCQVPIFTLYTQGQQIKVYSQMYKYCMFQNIVVEKDAYTVAENERYVGAKVFLPIPGKYKMVVPFDFASLYPTTIIAYNIDYHTWVPDDSSIPDHKCHVMEWEDHQACQHDPKVQRKIVLTEYLATERAKIKAMRDRRNKCLDKLRRKNMMIEINKEVEKLKPYTLERAELTKTISKITMCEKRRYRFLKEPKGVMPTILQNLLDARKHTRKVDMARVKKEIKSLEDSKEDNTDLIVAQKTLLDVLNKRQLSYKVSANSVGATTPIPCELNGEFVYRTIEEISKGDWKRINEEQEVSTPLDGLRVWSDLGFTVPKYVMRHPQDGKLIRTVTHTGMVETTNDHSLLRPNGDEVKPRDLRVGDKLMHHPTPLPTDTPREPLFRTISNDVIKNYKLETPKEEMAFVYGLFMAEGTAGTWGKRLSEKSSWIIYNSDIDLLERACEILNRLESVGENTFKIVLYPSNKDQSAKLDMYHLTCRGKVKKLCKKYRELLYDTRSHKKIPDYILASSLDVRQAFLMGYYSGDGARRLKCGVILRNKGHRVSAQLMYLARSLGYKVSVNYPEKKQTLISRLQCSTRLARDSESIKLIYPANTLNSLKPGEKIIRNGQLIQHVDGQSEYRRITLICDRLPRQKLLDSLDDAIEKAARIRKCYITEYNSKRKRLKLVKYCCGATHWVLLSSIKKELPWAFKRDGWCDCKHTTETNYNVVNEYKDEVPCDEYVYDIETENHHFAAGVGDIIVHNSMYGITGTRRGYLPFMPAAMCTTYMGRKNITRVAEELTHNHKGRLIYGDTDCVSPYTPLLILENDKMSYKMMEEISDGKWVKTVTGKEMSQAKPGTKIWSDKGFTDIVHVIRHAVEKPMIRVLTHTGVVICTLDHSLLWENGKAALGSEISIGDKLCQRKLPVPDDTPPEPVYPNRLTAEKIRDYIISDAVYEGLSASLAFVWGVFFADGSCGSYKQKNGIRNIWAITKGDNLLLERCLDILTTYEPSLDFKILDTMKSSKANKLVPKQKSRKKEHRGTIKILVEKYRKLFYNDKKYKIVPDIIFNAPYKIREAFFMGYYAGDGSKKDPALTITNKGEIGTAGMFFLMRSLGYKVSINTRGDKPDVYKITGSTPSKKFRYESNAVKKIDDYTNEFDYIYDIETANHHFAAGIGEMVVHNSNYIQFPHLNNATETWDYAIDVADKITKLFPPPMDHVGNRQLPTSGGINSVTA